MVLGVIRVSKRLQIEGPKFGRLRNKRFFRSTDQGECYCLHILSFFFIKSLSPALSVLWPLSIIVIFYVLSRKLIFRWASLFSVTRSSRTDLSMLVARALKIGQIADGGMPPTYQTMP